MGLTIVQVDAFTDTPFTGNPAAVCILPEARDEQWMQNIAKEMNLSETAFLTHQPQSDTFNLRWFTPAVEVELCGHATLASAHVLWEAGYLKPEAQARFNTLSGQLTAERQGSWIKLDFPATPEEAASPPPGLLDALGTTAIYIGKNKFDYIVEVDSEDTLRSIEPNYSLLATVPARGIIVTSRASTHTYDFVSRFFGPRVGVNEDPVTGSAHCCLAPYWCSRLQKDELVGYQASERGGVVRVRIDGDRVHLSGQAVTTMHATLAFA